MEISETELKQESVNHDNILTQKEKYNLKNMHTEISQHKEEFAEIFGIKQLLELCKGKRTNVEMFNALGGNRENIALIQAYLSEDPAMIDGILWKNRTFPAIKKYNQETISTPPIEKKPEETENNNTIEKIKTEQIWLKYTYLQQLAEAQNINICSTYAYCKATELLDKQGFFFNATPVNANQIKDSSHLNKTFTNENFLNLNDEGSKQKILNAPIGSLLTMKYSKTQHTDRWVSHVMVSLGNGKFSDLFGKTIRQIDFNNIHFKNKSFNYAWEEFTLTEDATIRSPKHENFDKSQKRSLYKENITPYQWINELEKKYNIWKNYLGVLISSQNNLKYSDFNTSQPKLTLTLPIKKIDWLNFNLTANANEVAKNFVKAIETNKGWIMSYFPGITSKEYNAIAEVAVGILYQETNAGESKTYQAKEFNIFWENIGQNVVDMGKNIKNIKNKAINIGKNIINWEPITTNTATKPKWENSRGYTQIKWNQYYNDNNDSTFKKIANKYGISADNITHDPTKCGIATMTLLLKNYKELIRNMNNEKRKTKNIHLSTVEDYMPYLYYKWNKPSEIRDATATPDDNIYIKNAKTFIAKNTTELPPTNEPLKA